MALAAQNVARRNSVPKSLTCIWLWRVFVKGLICSVSVGVALVPEFAYSLWLTLPLSGDGCFIGESEGWKERRESALGPSGTDRARAKAVRRATNRRKKPHTAMRLGPDSDVRAGTYQKAWPNFKRIWKNLPARMDRAAASARTQPGACWSRFPERSRRGSGRPRYQPQGQTAVIAVRMAASPPRYFTPCHFPGLIRDASGSRSKMGQSGERCARH